MMRGAETVSLVREGVHTQFDSHPSSEGLVPTRLIHTYPSHTSLVPTLADSIAFGLGKPVCYPESSYPGFIKL